MTNQKYFKSFQYLALIMWTSTLILLYPLPPQTLAGTKLSVSHPDIVKMVNQGEISKERVVRATNLSNKKQLTIVWAGWTFKLIFLAFGIFSSFLLFKTSRNWQYFMGVSSALYLVWWIFGMLELSSTINKPILESYVVSFSHHVLVDSFFSPLFFLYKNFFHPVFHLGVVTFMLYKASICHK